MVSLVVRACADVVMMYRGAKLIDCECSDLSGTLFLEMGKLWVMRSVPCMCIATASLYVNA